MPDHFLQRLRAEWSVVVAAVGFVVLVCLAQQLSDQYGGWIFTRTVYASGAWWQLWTSQWVHFGGLHAAVNATSLLLMLWAMRGWVAGALQCAALAGGYIGVAMVLALDPACAYYAGASGALHGFWAGNAVALLWGPRTPLQRPHGVRWLGGAMLLAMVLKLWLQQCGVNGAYPWQTLDPLFGTFDGPQFPVYDPAHFAGAAGGVAAVLLYGLCRRFVAAATAQRPAGEKQ